MKISEWQNPGSAWRSSPFWSWNGEMKPESLVKQVNEMHAAGMGGFFMHSRSGLKTDYMGEEWMDCIKACIDEAKKLDMQANLYDEDKYCSGNAGGEITRHDITCASKIVVIRKKCPLKENETRLAEFNISFDGYYLTDYSLSENGEYVFDVMYQDLEPWHNFAHYSDVCYSKTIEKYLEHTHDAYYKKFGEEFGKTIQYMFSDEIKINRLEDVRKWPEDIIAAAYWSTDLREVFKKYFNYDLAEKLPELFYRRKGENFSKVSHDYLYTLSRMMSDNCFKKMGDWCEEHNIELTGHIRLAGFHSALMIGMPMQQLQHFGMPGMDTLTDSVQKVSAMKQCASVCNQTGKRRMISEMYGCTGWDWPLAKHKFHGDWEYALGVNYRCQHLTHYTVAGFGKRDYPASISAHSAWWKYYNRLEDYFARLSYAMSQGVSTAKTLVLCPEETILGYYDGIHLKDSSPTYVMPYKISDRWEETVKYLNDRHIIFDFGDEELMLKNVEISKNEIKIGEMKYDTVILLSVETIRKTTLDILKKTNVKLLICEDYPSMVDSEPSNLALDYLSKRENTILCSDNEAVFKNLEKTVKITSNNLEETETWCQFKKSDDGYYLFIAPNVFEFEKDLKVAVTLPKEMNAYRLLCENGTVTLQDGYFENDEFIFNVTVKQGDSILVYFTDNEISAEHVLLKKEIKQSKTVNVKETQYRLGEKNILPLDNCRYKLGDGEFSDNITLAQIESELLSKYNLPTKEFYLSAQPWFLYNTGYIDTKPKDSITMRFAFDVKDIPKECMLALEYDKRFNISANGNILKEPCGTTWDDFINCFDISEYLKSGKNIIELKFNYQADMEIENMYLVGDFGVYLENSEKGSMYGNYYIDKLPQTLKVGILRGQGLDFYTGSIFYKIESEENIIGLSVNNSLCTCMALHNGEKTDVKLWGNYQFNFENTGKEIELEVIFGRKNLFGPLHAEVTHLVEPHYFDYGSNVWQENYVLAQNSSGEIQLEING